MRNEFSNIEQKSNTLLTTFTLHTSDNEKSDGDFSFCQASKLLFGESHDFYYIYLI